MSKRNNKGILRTREGKYEFDREKFKSYFINDTTSAIIKIGIIVSSYLTLCYLVGYTMQLGQDRAAKGLPVLPFKKAA